MRKRRCSPAAGSFRLERVCIIERVGGGRTAPSSASTGGCCWTVAGRRPNCIRSGCGDRSTEPGQIDATNRQRLFTPGDIDADLGVVAVDALSTRCTGHVTFSDGHVARSRSCDASSAPSGGQPTPKRRPRPTHGRGRSTGSRTSTGTASGSTRTTKRPRRRHRVPDGCSSGTATSCSATRRRRGRHRGPGRRSARATSRSTTSDGCSTSRPSRRPTDLAYTPIELLAHSDEPYRQPVPGIQMLHCISQRGTRRRLDARGRAGGGAQRSQAERPDLARRARSRPRSSGATTWAPTRSSNRGHMLEYDRHGEYRQIRFNTKLDEPVAATRASTWTSFVRRSSLAGRVD